MFDPSNEQVLTIRHSMFFLSGKGPVACFALMLGGIALISEGESSMQQFLGIIVIILALAFCTFSYGMQIDFHTKRVRGYSSFFGKKFGSWEPLSNYNYLVVLITYKAEREDGAPHGFLDFNERGIYLYHSQTHKRSLVESHKVPDKLMDRADELSKKLKIEILSYE